jgi:hypothetical protein
MKSLNSLQTNDDVTSSANIFFDYNFPIETNDATTIFEALSNQNFTKDNSVKVYPNPASNVAFISLGLTNPTDVTLTVMNASGQVIDYLPIGNIPSGEQTFQLDTKSYTNGVYFVTISTTEGVVTKKLIINN